MTQPSHPIPLTDMSPGSTAPVEPDRPRSPVVVTPPITANILLVDDDPGSLMAMETLLAGPGRTIVTAESGQDALRHLLQQDFAVILLDVRMPRLDGFETAALIRGRARSCHTPIIFLSAADTMDADVFRGYSVGAVDYLFKPFIPEILKAKVTVFVDLFQIRDRVRQQSEQLGAINQKLDQDITDRKRAEAALRASEEQKRTILNLAHEAFITIDADGVITDWNHQAEVTLGWSHGEALGKPLAETIIPQRYRDAHKGGLKRFLATGEGPVLNKRIEITALHRDGHELPVELTITPIRLGEKYLFSAFLHDITERKRAEEEIKKSNTQLEAANKELESFSYSVSHDLRAPLRAMEGFSQALLQDYGDRLDHVGQDYAQRIVNAAQHLDGLIQDLLAYSRLSQGELELVPVDLTRLLQDVQGQLKTVLQERQARVTVREPLPWVLGRNTTTGQILQNLLSNAVKFVASGVQPQVRVWAEERDKLVRLWVEDNGIGIAPEHQERIFRIFERLHGIETYPGTGIGLAIVRKAVERMGGRVGVESALGQGSRFWMELQNAGSPR